MFETRSNRVNRRDVLIGVMATRQERQRLRQLAKQAGVSMADFTRRAWQLAAQQVQANSAEVSRDRN